MASAVDESGLDKQVALLKPKLDLLCDVCSTDCEPKVARYQCEQCQHNLCEDCEVRHASDKSTSAHKVFIIEEGIVTNKIKETCRHKSYLYCGVCNRIICSKCVRRLHRRHGIHVDVPKPSSACPAIPGNVADMLQNKLEAYEKEMRQFDPETNEKIRQLRVKAHDLKAEVDVIHQEALAEMKLIEQENTKHLTEYKDRLMEKKQRYEEKLQTVREKLKYMDGIEALEYVEKTKKEIDEMYYPSEPMPESRGFDTIKYEDRFLEIKDRLTATFDAFTTDKKKKKKKSKA